MDFDVRTKIAAILSAPPPGGAIAYHDIWLPWSALRQFRLSLDKLVEEAAPPRNSTIALIARNRPAHIAAMAAQVASGRATSMIYSSQSPAGIATDIRAVRAPVILADPLDWTEETIKAAQEVGSLGVAITANEQFTAQILENTRLGRDQKFRHIDPMIGFEMLSSGTTGLPKRVPLAWSTLSSATRDAHAVYAGTGAIRAPQIMLHPVGNIAGVSYLLPAFAYAQQLILLEKFEARAWIDTVRRYLPVRSALPAAGVQMILDTHATRDDLASLSVVVVGGSKLEMHIQTAFEDRFGIPLLTAYGATEFAGVIANWTLDAYQRFGATKLGSCGRASPNVELRIVDPESFIPLTAFAIGLLEAKVDRLGTDWIRTNDLASLDTDGFLFIYGRADGAINRGGFKIVPEVVVEALKLHPAIADAAVVAKPDARLGEIPVAAVELKPCAVTDSAELKAHLRDRLTAYQIPVEIAILDALPRNASVKIALGEILKMLNIE